jgi:hypothetical protein
MNITEYLLDYFSNNNIPLDEVSLNTGVPKAKLKVNAGHPLTAEEFFNICAYLSLSPEKVFKEIKKSTNPGA